MATKSGSHGGLDKWFSEKWVDVSRPKKGGGYEPCGRDEAKGKKDYPKCLPAKKAVKLSSAERKSAVFRKRRVEKAEPAEQKGRKPNYVATKKKK
jgi:hypothetical protein